eukprot:Blabericola_migrator_1__3621@NODE_2080_length_3304_cov_92_275255_g1318_i0_p1_GENE_NODE_2080_length_3304_cov_92_275255_g1318_i0NODE_2080_length_3304_cov_92_275255_g1318_i0_p1_ORF_typecomplete_len1081_score208_32_NODE_2080_length_3304_cov_92_275255_g1318_i0602981
MLSATIQLTPSGSLGVRVQVSDARIPAPSVERLSPPSPNAFPMPPSPRSKVSRELNGVSQQRRLVTLNSQLSFADDGKSERSFMTAQHSLYAGFQSPAMSVEGAFDRAGGPNNQTIESILMRPAPARSPAASPRYALKRSTLDVPGPYGVCDTPPDPAALHHTRSSTIGGKPLSSILRTNPAAMMRTSPGLAPKWSPSINKRFQLPLSRAEEDAKRTPSVASTAVPPIDLHAKTEGPKLSPTSGGGAPGATQIATHICDLYQCKRDFENITKQLMRLERAVVSDTCKVYHSFHSIYLFLNRFVHDTHEKFKGVMVRLDQEKNVTTIKILAPLAPDEPYAHLLIPVDFSSTPVLRITPLKNSTRGRDDEDELSISIPLSTMLVFGMTGLEGVCHFLDESRQPRHQTSVELAVQMQRHQVAGTMSLLERNPRVSLATITAQRSMDAFSDSRSVGSQNARIPSPNSSCVSAPSQPSLGQLIQKYNHLSVTVLSLDDKFKSLPEVMEGESTDTLTCKVSLGMTAGLKSLLRGWRSSSRKPVPHKFLYNGERVLRVCLFGPSKVVIGQLRIDLHTLIRTGVDTFRGAVQLTTNIADLKGATATILLEFSHQHEAGIPASPALSWRSALEGGSLLRLRIDEIRANDLSCLHKVFTVRLSCGPIRIKSQKLRIPADETSRMTFNDLYLDLPIDDELLRKTDEKSVILSIYVKDTQSRQNRIFQLIKLTCSNFKVPSKLPRVWTGELLLNLSAGTPMNTPRCCVRVAMTVCDGVLFDLPPQDAEATPRLRATAAMPVYESSLLGEQQSTAETDTLAKSHTASTASVSPALKHQDPPESVIPSLTESPAISDTHSIAASPPPSPRGLAFGLLVSSCATSDFNFNVVWVEEPDTPMTQAEHIKMHVMKPWTEQPHFCCWELEADKVYRLRISGSAYMESSVLIPLPELLLSVLKDKSWAIPVSLCVGVAHTPPPDTHLTHLGH